MCKKSIVIYSYFKEDEIISRLSIEIKTLLYLINKF